MACSACVSAACVRIEPAARLGEPLGGDEALRPDRVGAVRKAAGQHVVRAAEGVEEAPRPRPAAPPERRRPRPARRRRCPRSPPAPRARAPPPPSRPDARTCPSSWSRRRAASRRARASPRAAPCRGSGSRPRPSRPSAARARAADPRPGRGTGCRPAWQWVLTSPGASSMPPASTTRAASAADLGRRADADDPPVRDRHRALAEHRAGGVAGHDQRVGDDEITRHRQPPGGPGPRLARGAIGVNATPLCSRRPEALSRRHDARALRPPVLVLLPEGADRALRERDARSPSGCSAPDDPATFAEFAALWPLRRMPVLVDDGRPVVEFERHHRAPRAASPGAGAADPRRPGRRARGADARPLLRQLRDDADAEDRRRPHPARGERDPHGVAEARALLDTAYRWLDGRLAGRDWAAGADFTLADCAAAPALFYADWVHPIADELAARARLSRPACWRARRSRAPSTRRGPTARCSRPARRTATDAALAPPRTLPGRVPRPRSAARSPSS